MRKLILQAINNSDDWVIAFRYRDSKGNTTHRVVSPIRFLGEDRVLGLCLAREEPRQFYFNRCENIQLKRACDFVMPIAI